MLRTGNSRQYPARDLPVTANPAVTPGHVRVIRCRVVLIELYVIQESGPRITAFDKVVAENAIFRKTAAQYLLEGIHLIESRADDRTLAENILVDVAYRARVWINARIATPEP